MTINRQKIDKAFLIAKPMRKADRTKRFAAGWGSGALRTVMASSVREADVNRPAVFVRYR
jgi:hypothetical protein